jgi:multiple sugar transport system permease protein
MTALDQAPATTQERAPARRQARRMPPPATIITVAVLIVAAVYFLLPVYWLIVASTKTSADLFGSFGLWFTHPQFFTNMRELFDYQDGIYLRWLINTLIYAGVSAIVAMLICASAGYCLAKFAFRGRELIFNIILGGVLVPGTALALPLYLLINKLGIGNTYWSVLLPSIVSPFGVYLCRIYAESGIPDDIIEAARIDGAGEFYIFRSLVLRIMSPALVTVFLFHFVGTWNNYFLPLVMLSNEKLFPVTLGLTTWQGFAQRQPILYQLTVGGAFVSVVPLMIIIVWLQRYWRGGLTQGSVKG